MIWPLIVMWAFANRFGSAPARASVRKASPPRWPTPASPPPMPAFQAQTRAAPSADPGQSSTPLADLHANPPRIAPASAPDAIKRSAIRAFKTRSTSLLKQRARSANPLDILRPSNTAASVSVAAVQRVLSSRGVKIVQDGLYGPRTASAWSKLAASKGLPPTIARVGPKVAKVVARTYESLSVPAIP